MITPNKFYYISKNIIILTYLVSIFFTYTPGYTQDNQQENDSVSISLQSVRISDALKMLFENHPNDKYTLNAKDADKFPISISLDDVPFDVAFDNILKSANLTYKMRGNTYLITKKPEPKTASQTATLPTTKPMMTVRIPINNVEAGTIAAALGGYTLKLSSNPYDNSRASNTNSGNSKKKGKGKNKGKAGNRNQGGGQRR